MKFTGHERDLANTTSAADDLDYMHARFYNPLTGRFLSTDPVLQLDRARSNPQLWNRFASVLNNPLSYVDPTGAVVNLASMSDDDRKRVMKELSATTGLMLKYDAQTETLKVVGQVKSASGEVVGSETARNDLMSAIGAQKTYYGISRNGSSSVNMGKRVGSHIYLDFTDIERIDTGNNDPTTFNAGMIFLHELKHAQGLRDPNTGMLSRVPGVQGKTVEHMNRIRRELGLSLRGQYATQIDSTGRHYIPFTDGPVYVPGEIK